MAKKVMVVLMLALSLSGCGKKEEPSKISRAYCTNYVLEPGTIGFIHLGHSEWVK